MTKQEQTEHLEAFTKRMSEVLLSKGDDYANTDRLSNFKLAGSICGLSPAQNCLSLIATKVARLGVLLKSETEPNNESIRDSILDLANYASLLDMIVHESMGSPSVLALRKPNKDELKSAIERLSGQGNEMINPMMDRPDGIHQK